MTDPRFEVDDFVPWSEETKAMWRRNRAGRTNRPYIALLLAVFVGLMLLLGSGVLD